MNWFSLLQWPAMIVTVAAAWFVGSQRSTRRKVGFWCFILGNALWIVWGWHAQAWALIVLQVFLLGTNLSGARKNEQEES